MPCTRKPELTFLPDSLYLPANNGNVILFVGGYMNIGEKYGMLTVTGFQRVPNGVRNTRIDAVCVCDCGNERLADKSKLRRGITTNCGCITRKMQSESAKKRGATYEKHRLINTPTYYSWAGMKSRCLNPKDSRYKDYGGRGIKVCKEWHNFRNFLKDMGLRPKGHTLDRIDVNGNYEPSNCRWATLEMQAANKRN